MTDQLGVRLSTHCTSSPSDSISCLFYRLKLPFLLSPFTSLLLLEFQS